MKNLNFVSGLFLMAIGLLFGLFAFNYKIGEFSRAGYEVHGLVRQQITEKLPVASLSKVAILASLNIADELFKERASRESEGVSLTDRTARLHAVLDRLDHLLEDSS